MGEVQNNKSDVKYTNKNRKGITEMSTNNKLNSFGKY